MTLRFWTLPFALWTPFFAAHPQGTTTSPTHAVELSLLTGPLDYGTYFTGPRANDELADHLIGNGLLTAADLALIDTQERRLGT